MLLLSHPDNVEFWPGHLSSVSRPSGLSAVLQCVLLISPSGFWVVYWWFSVQSSPVIFRVLLVTKDASAFIGSQRAEGWSLCQDIEEANHTHDLDLINIVLEPGEPAFHGIVWLWIVSTPFWSRVHTPAFSGRPVQEPDENVRDNQYLLPPFNSLRIGLGCADGDLAPRQTNTDKMWVKSVREEGLLESGVSMGGLMTWLFHGWG